jgi:hypothetical protein
MSYGHLISTSFLTLVVLVHFSIVKMTATSVETSVHSTSTAPSEYAKSSVSVAPRTAESTVKMHVHLAKCNNLERVLAFRAKLPQLYEKIERKKHKSKAITFVTKADLPKSEVTKRNRQARRQPRNWNKKFKVVVDETSVRYKHRKAY